MKITFLILLLCFGISCFSQVTPSKVVKVSTNSISFNENLPSGTLLINIATGKQYLSLQPLASTKTIGTCILNTDIREIGGDDDEIQTLTVGMKSGTTQYLAIDKGNIINFDVADGDSNGTNELNTGIAWDPETKSVSVTDAGGKKSVAISGFLQSELDGDATNELQDLALTDQTLSISSGNSVDLSGLGGASSLDGLSDVKYGGDNFSDGLLLGHTRTGALNDARANLGIMDGSLKRITSGDWNIGIGASALSGVTSGFLNIGIGSFSFTSLTTEIGNVGLGPNTGNKSKGIRNTAIGMDAMSNQDGVATENVVIGNEALKNIVSRTSTITKNIAIGSKAGVGSTGAGNIYLGYNSGSKAASTTDNNNIYIGYQSGLQVSGSNNIILGIGTSPSVFKYPFSEEDIPVFSNKLLIGHQATPLITGDLGTMFDGSARGLTLYGATTISDAYTLPTTDGAGDQVLTTDGNGTVSWASAGGSAHSIGEFYGGGIVFWVDETGEHGLICAKEDLSAKSRWWGQMNTSTYTMAIGDGPFSGEMNTMLIMCTFKYGDGDTYAARVCAELQLTERGKTYGDWYLPSKEELRLMYENRALINSSAISNGGGSFTNSYYWSSTEDKGGDMSYYNAWVLYFLNGTQQAYSKGAEFYIRPIRAF